MVDGSRQIGEGDQKSKDHALAVRFLFLPPLVSPGIDPEPNRAYWYGQKDLFFKIYIFKIDF